MGPERQPQLLDEDLGERFSREVWGSPRLQAVLLITLQASNTAQFQSSLQAARIAEEPPKARIPACLWASYYCQTLHCWYLDAAPAGICCSVGLKAGTQICTAQDEHQAQV